MDNSVQLLKTSYLVKFSQSVTKICIKPTKGTLLNYNFYIKQYVKPALNSKCLFLDTATVYI